jgi:hypothetical protein
MHHYGVPLDHTPTSCHKQIWDKTADTEPMYLAPTIFVQKTRTKRCFYTDFKALNFVTRMPIPDVGEQFVSDGRLKKKKKTYLHQ